jgi:hypothetical protein
MRGFVATLSDGKVYREWEIKTEVPPWIFLKNYIKEHKLNIVKIHLQFNHQEIHMPNFAKAYFYSKRVSSLLGGDTEVHQWGIGASYTKDNEVTITWYDGQDGVEEFRKVDCENPAFIVC